MLCFRQRIELTPDLYSANGSEFKNGFPFPCHAMLDFGVEFHLSALLESAPRFARIAKLLPRYLFRFISLLVYPFGRSPIDQEGIAEFLFIFGFHASSIALDHTKVKTKFYSMKMFSFRGTRTNLSSAIRTARCKTCRQYVRD